jgi:hypothetical protein
MPDELALALAVSARDWPDRLRQFLADHGGARVRLTALGQHDLDEEEYDVLFVDDICSFLSRGLVGSEHHRGRVVIGVFDPGEPVGEAHLVAAGVDAVIAADEPADAFVASARHNAGSLLRRGRHQPQPAVHGTERRGSLVVVEGVSGGVGTSEIALGLALLLADSVLVELAPFPSVAQRLGLELHPNLVTAIELVDHGDGEVSGALQRVSGDSAVLVGAPERSSKEVSGARRVVDRIRKGTTWTLLDTGTRTVGGAADHTVVVAPATPVGIGRCIDHLRESELTSTHVALNRAPSGRFERAEVLGAVLEEVRPRSVTILPDDRAVTTAAWNGHPVRTGPFWRAVHSLRVGLGGSA